MTMLNVPHTIEYTEEHYFALKCETCGLSTEIDAPTEAEEWATSHTCDFEPTDAQLEAMNNPDSGPSNSAYRYQMNDAGRGHLIR